MSTRILIAPDSYKGSLSAGEVSEIIANCLSVNKNLTIKKLPLGDGGDGTARILADKANADCFYLSTYDALQRQIIAPVYIYDDTVIIEMADIAGLKLIYDKDINPAVATSGGVGVIIKRLFNAGYRKYVICIGGSATVDAGIGALNELGVVFTDSSGNIIKDVKIGDAHRICSADLSGIAYLKNISLDILCDVENPLLGVNGAINVYGPQKGVSENDLDKFNNIHEHICRLFENLSGKKIADVKHLGAAGGFATGFYAFLNAKLHKGISYVFDAIDFENEVKDCDVLITGEGKMDSQSQYGKAPFEAANTAYRYGKRIVAVNGKTEYLHKIFDRSFSLTDYAPNINTAINNPRPYLEILCNDLNIFLNG